MAFLLRPLLQAGAGYVAGQGIQAALGTSGPSEPRTTAPPTTPAETYRREQQSNEYMPPDQSFMSLPWWGAGAAAARVMPQQALEQSVNTFSDPSNPASTQNRSRATSAATALSAFVPGPLGVAARLATGATLGAEHQAQSQSAATPRLPPNPAVHTEPAQIQQDYQALSGQYAGAGYTPQSRVVATMPPTATNAQVSHSIHERLLPDQPSPFTGNR